MRRSLSLTAGTELAAQENLICEEKGTVPPKRNVDTDGLKFWRWAFCFFLNKIFKKKMQYFVYFTTCSIKCSFCSNSRLYKLSSPGFTSCHVLPPPHWTEALCEWLSASWSPPRRGLDLQTASTFTGTTVLLERFRAVEGALNPRSLLQDFNCGSQRMNSSVQSPTGVFWSSSRLIWKQTGCTWQQTGATAGSLITSVNV